MKRRTYWENMIENAWERSAVLWLSGARKTGKTMLCKNIRGVRYFNCDLPSDRRLLHDHEDFLAMHEGQRIIIDEIQRLRKPLGLLQAALDQFPSVKILAIGPSTLTTSPDFVKNLSGRVEEIMLTPMMSAGLTDFDNDNVIHRLMAGGLPPFFMDGNPPEKEFQEWLDSYWAKDVQDNFRLEKRWSFQRFLEMIFQNSGDVFEASKYAEPCEISRPTVVNYLKVMERTYVAYAVHPFTTRLPTEIVSAPKVYAFDTGFICYFRGWRELHADDLKNLWEHFILNEIQSRAQKRDVFYWRDKHGHQVDFVLVDDEMDTNDSKGPIAIECSWLAEEADTRDIRAFRRRYPVGENWIIAQDMEEPMTLSERGLELKVMGLRSLATILEVGKKAKLTA